MKCGLLTFLKVAESGVKPDDLKMTAVNGSKFTTAAKVKDENSVKTFGGVKAKYNKKDSAPVVKTVTDLFGTHINAGLVGFLGKRATAIFAVVISFDISMSFYCCLSFNFNPRSSKSLTKG